MITRIEIDGFKSFVDFSLDLPPFLAIAGRNTSGKSNLLDALAFMAAVARGERLVDAVRMARGDAISLFHRREDGTAVERMTFAGEFILNVPEDESFVTRWRYECELGWTGAGRARGRVLAVLRERFIPLTEDADRWPERFPMSDAWRERHIRYASATEDDQSLPVPAVVASTSLGEDFRLPDREPGIRHFSEDEAAWSAARNCALELAETLVLRLEPVAIAKPSPLGFAVRMGENGDGLAAWLHRMQEMTLAEDERAGILAEVNADLTRLIRDATDVRLVTDEERGDVRLRFQTRNDHGLEAAQASDGTLRVTAILSALHNPERYGLLAIEEPENGVFPERFGELLEMVRASATDMIHDDPAWSLQQTLITSHSPALLDVIPHESVIFLEAVSRVADGGVSRVTRPRRLRGEGERRVRTSDELPPLSISELEDFRSPAAGTR